MKNYIGLALATIILIALLASCGRSPYKKRHRCRGNGSWYGHRNLGQIDSIKTQLHKDKYQWCTVLNEENI